MTHIPPLTPGCNSWIISRKNGEVIGEFWSRSSVEKFNPDKCTIETAYQYLCRLNRQIATNTGQAPKPGVPIP